MQALTAEEPAMGAGAPEVGGLSGFLGELGRRRVYRVFIGYVVVAIALAEGAKPFWEALELPASFIDKTLPAVLIGGLPLALVLSWMFDLTGTGVQRTAATNLEGGSLTLRRVYMSLGLGLAVVLSGLLVWFVLSRPTM